jgi:hypothetical protein
MPFPPKDRWPHSLADPRGVWCAQCLGYIDEHPPAEADRCEEHHIVPTELVKQLYGGPVVKDWVVPVHQRCHQGLKRDSRGRLDDFSAGIQERFVRLLYLREDQQVLAARDLYERGNYGAALLLHSERVTALARRGDYDGCIVALRDAISSASGFRWGDWLASVVLQLGLSRQVWPLTFHESAGPRSTTEQRRYSAPGVVVWTPQQMRRFRPPSLLTPADVADPALRLAIANDIMAHGRVQEASSWLATAERIATSDNEGAIHRRRANIRQSITEAIAAFDCAENDYTRATARMAEATLRYQRGEFTRVRAIIKELRESGAQLSLLYEAHCWYLEALCELEADGHPKNIYQLLAQAQYAFCMLGYRAHANSVPSNLVVHNPAMCTPGFVLLRTPCLSYNRATLYRWRHDAIGPPESWGSPGSQGPHTLWSRVRQCLDLGDVLYKAPYQSDASSTLQR